MNNVTRRALFASAITGATLVVASPAQAACTVSATALTCAANTTTTDTLNAGVSPASDYLRAGCPRSQEKTPIRSVFYCTGTGFRFQISFAYSRIVRSLENFPMRAVFNTAILAHFVRSRYAASIRA